MDSFLKKKRKGKERKEPPLVMDPIFCGKNQNSITPHHQPPIIFNFRPFVIRFEWVFFKI